LTTVDSEVKNTCKRGELPNKNWCEEKTTLFRKHKFVQATGIGELTSEERSRNRYNFTRPSARRRSSSIQHGASPHGTPRSGIEAGECYLPTCIGRQAGRQQRDRAQGTKGGGGEELKGWELTWAVALGFRHRPSTPELRRRRIRKLLLLCGGGGGGGDGGSSPLGF